MKTKAPRKGEPTHPSLLKNHSHGAGSITAGACRRYVLLIGAAFASLTLSACNEEKLNSDGSLSSEGGGRSLSVLGSIRPKADPHVLEKIRAEEAEARRKAEEAIAAQAQSQQQQNAAADPANRDLPAVDQTPISASSNPMDGIANAFGFGNNNQPQQPSGMGMGMGNPAMSIPSVPTPPPQAASYGGYPSMGGGGMIPPPPAVTLSTQAAYSPPIDPNYAQYMQGGGYGYGQPAYPQPYAAPPGPAHPAGSMFSNGGSNSAASAPAEEPKKKPSVVLITPTGMEARSPYKQRDELKVLVKGAFASASPPELRDPKISLVLAKTDVGLPAEATRGNISLTQRQIDNLFKTPPIDRRIMPSIKKVETDVAQAYFRYLYAFNKYTLTQQQVAARKQEMEVADSNSERQRAAADLSAAQNDAEGSKDDLRAAQTDLAAVAGAQAARSVITKVSGVTPSLESLAVASDSDSSATAQGGLIGSVQNAFGALNFWNKGRGGKEAEPVAAAPPEKAQKAPKQKDQKDKKKGGKGESGAATQIAITPDVQESAPEPVKPTPAPSTGISFELKNVQTTPRKSVLKVAVRNNREESFNLDPDVISVLEGDHKLAEAAVRAEFDSTLVGPNQEVTGTITIFGRPWNDKLSVSLSEGGRTIQLHR